MSSLDWYYNETEEKLNFIRSLEDTDNLKKLISDHPNFFSVFKHSLEDERYITTFVNILEIYDPYLFRIPDDCEFTSLFFDLFIRQNFLREQVTSVTDNENRKYISIFYSSIAPEIESLLEKVLIGKHLDESASMQFILSLELRRILKRIQDSEELMSFIDKERKKLLMNHNLKN